LVAHADRGEAVISRKFAGFTEARENLRMRNRFAGVLFRLLAKCVIAPRNERLAADINGPARRVWRAVCHFAW